MSKIFFLALMLLSSCAFAWEQTTTCGNNSPACQNDLPTQWQTPCIALHLNIAASANIALDDAAPIAQEAIQTWLRPDVSALTPHFAGFTDEDRVGYNPYTKKNANIIVFRDDRWDDDRSIIALTTVTHHNETGSIYDADIELNTATYPFGIVSRDGSHVVDFQNTLTHELGHVFGLAHSDIPDATMAPYSGLGDTSLSSLSQDDLDAIATIYPPKKMTCHFHDGFFTKPPFAMDERPPADNACLAAPLRKNAPTPWFFLLFLPLLRHLNRKKIG